VTNAEFVLVALAGLPGTGKSTLAGALAEALDAPLFDKDAVRAALYAPERIEYSREQDDFVMSLIHLAVEREVRRGGRCAVLDGRTYSRTEQVDALAALAQRCAARLALIECVADEAVVRARLAADRGQHSAANRDPELYLRLRASAEPITRAKLVVDTARGSTAEHVARCLEWIAAAR
jgi:predicted kinase